MSAASLTERFRVDLAVPEIEDFLRLRRVSGLSERSRVAAVADLPNTLFAVTVYDAKGNAVAMGRVVGDGGLNFEVVDIAVDPPFQGQGLGRLVMTHISDYLDVHVPPGSYISLIADTPWLYEKFGFEYCAPMLQGMQRKRPLPETGQS
ncbi:MAG: GNAT family N-acetyltransferase [Pseudohongiellaceae bacterium]